MVDTRLLQQLIKSLEMTTSIMKDSVPLIESEQATETDILFILCGVMRDVRDYSDYVQEQIALTTIPENATIN